MIVKYSLLTLIIGCFLGACVCGCASYPADPAPLDIIKGNEDIQQEYYKSILKNPVKIRGTIKSKTTSEPVAKAVITARLENSKTLYTTLSKDDGTFSLYVEGNYSYIIYGQKVGFDKSYYFLNNSGKIDTTFSLSSNVDYNILLAVHDPTPLFKVNTPSSINLFYYTIDLGFDGTNLNAISDGSDFAYYFNATGSYVKYTNFKPGMTFFCSQGTVTYWTGNRAIKTLYKLDPKTGAVASTITCQIPNASLVDVEVFNSNIWLLGTTSIYKLSLTGDLITTMDLTKVIATPDVRGFVQKDNFLYVLNYSVESTSYTLYKIDPATLGVVSKGNISPTINNNSLAGLAFDKTNFWTIDKYNYDLVKFSITE